MISFCDFTGKKLGLKLNAKLGKKCVKPAEQLSPLMFQTIAKTSHSGISPEGQTFYNYDKYLKS